jgi:hypothetical protein
VPVPEQYLPNLFSHATTGFLPQRYVYYLNNKKINKGNDKV